MTLRGALKELGIIGEGVATFLEVVQGVTRIGGDGAAETLKAIDAAISTALASGSLEDLQAAIDGLAPALAKGEAANDANAKSIEDARFPKGG